MVFFPIYYLDFLLHKHMPVNIEMIFTPVNIEILNLLP